MKETIVILHGWKVSNYYTTLSSLLEKQGYRVYVPILPGFKDIPLPKESMTLDDYVAFVYAFCHEKKLTHIILIGHSFGGRIACKFVSTYPHLVTKLVLTGAPLIKHPLSLKKKGMYVFAKGGKIVTTFFPSALKDMLRKFLYRGIGELDYYKAGKLKETFKNIIKENLFPLLPTIQTETLLIWGEQDQAVPVQDARTIVAVMPHASLQVVKYATHKLPYENPKEFFTQLRNFLA